MFDRNLLVTASSVAMASAMPPQASRATELAKRPTTKIGSDVAAKHEKVANEVHSGLRQIGLTAVYALFTIRKVLGTAGAQSVVQRTGNSVPMSPEFNQAVSDARLQDTVLADMVRESLPLFTKVQHDGEEITFSFETANRVDMFVDPRADSFTALIKRLIPEYDAPQAYNRKNYGANGTLEFSEDAKFNSTITYEALVKAIESAGLEGASALFLGKAKLPKGVTVSVNLQGDLNSNVVYYAGTNNIIGVGRQDITSIMYAKVPVNVRISVTVPVGWAMWSTYAETEDEFVPNLAMSHFSIMINTAMGFARSRNTIKSALQTDAKTTKAQLAKLAKVSMRVSNVATAKRRNASRAKFLGFEAKVRTNADGYAILPNGSVWYIPSVDNVAEYVRLSKEAASADEDAPRFKYPSRLLYVDAVNEVLVYTNTTSEINTLNLRGCKPLDDISAAKNCVKWALTSSAGRLLPIYNGSLEMSAPASFMQALIARMAASQSGLAGSGLSIYFGDLFVPVTKGGARHPATSLFTPSDWRTIIDLRDRNGNYMFPDFAEREKFIKLTINRNANTDIEEAEDAEDRIIAKLHEAALAFVNESIKFDIAGGFDNAVPEGEHNVEVRNTVRLALYSLTKLLPRYKDLQAGLRKAQYANQTKPLDRASLKDKPIAIPGFDVSKTPFLFPHQAEVMQNLGNDDLGLYALIGGAPGFGKTITIMGDALKLLERGKIKRPLVVVPNKLERQFISEIQTFTNGKINGFCATFQNLKDMQSPDGLNFSYEDTVKFLRELPPNTILVTNYNTLTNSFSQFPELYEAVASYDTVGVNNTLTAFPFVDMFYAAGVDYVCGDESHKVKNIKSSRAQAFLALCAKTEYVRLSSGTTVNNVVSDLVGQLQKINPLALGGSVDEFRDKFLDGDSQVTSASQAEAITDAMRDYSLVIQKDSRSWAYMLPPMQEIYHRVPLTTLQARYYNILFYRATVNIKKSASDKRIDIDNIDADSSEAADAVNSRMEKIAARHFGVIDKFVNSPDSFTDFVDGTWTAEEENVARIKANKPELTPEEREAIPPIVPDKDDLISVKAKRAYDLMYAHFGMRNKLATVRGTPGSENYQSDPDNKLIVLAPYIITGTHLYDNMPADLKAMAARYQANDFAAVERFKNDPSVKILVADEISITEGHNLQVASRIIRMQGVWTPGAETQALARIRRPDMKGARARLGYDVISATLPNERPTIDDLRTARLLAKKLSNAKVEFGYERSFQTEVGQVVAALSPVTMSMTNIETFPTALLAEYFGALGKLNDWSYNSAKAITKQIGKDIEEETGEVLVDANGNIIDREKFFKAAVIYTTAAPDLAGSKTVYTPWVEGVMPINPLGFDMIPVRSATAMSRDDADDEDDDTEDEDAYEMQRNNVALKIGSRVMTEYGPGIITKLGRRSRAGNGELNDPGWFWIGIPSMKGEGAKYKKVRLPATRIYVPRDAAGDRILADAIKAGKRGIAPQPKPITKGQIDDAQQRRADRKAEKDRRNSEDDGVFTDYDAPDVYDAEDFDLEDADFDIEDDEDVDADPIDILADMIDDDGEFTDEEDDEEEEEEGEEEEDGVSLYGDVITINGQYAMLLDDLDESGAGLDQMITDYGFKRIPDFARLEIKTKQALDTVLAKLSKAKYVIPPQNLREITTIAEGLTRRGRLTQSEQYNFKEVTNFLLTEQRRVPTKSGKGAPQTARLYAMVMKGKFYLCGSISKHPFNLESMLTRLGAAVPGTGDVAVFDDMGVRFMSTKREALAVAKKLIGADVISNPEELLEAIESVSSGGLVGNPSTKPEPEAKPAPQAKPKAKPVSKPANKSDYKEGKLNPDVESIKEFKDFLKMPKATMALIKGTALPLNVHYRVKSYNTKTFGLSNTIGQNDPDTFEFFYIPTLADKPKFNNEAGTMTIGKSTWLLSYDR